MGLQIRKATSEDIPGMIMLFSSSISTVKSASFFQWWNNTPSITYCAIIDGELIGMFLVLKRKLINHLTCGVLMGLIVNTAWRGKGLFKELGDKAMGHFEDIDLFCCLTNKIGKKALEKHFGFRTVDTIETMTLACKTNDYRSKIITIPITLDTIFNSFSSDREKRLMFLADEKFRRWRFASHCIYSYDMLQMESNEYLIINKHYDTEKNIRYVDIVDFEIEFLEEDKLVSVIDNACSSLPQDMDMITIQAVPNSLIHKVSRKVGFVESNIKHYFCIRETYPHNDYLYNSTNWLIKWGDYLR